VTARPRSSKHPLDPGLSTKAFPGGELVVLLEFDDVVFDPAEHFVEDLLRDRNGVIFERP
jgi:hypothetical protein